jgi:hypothetical protein
VLIDVAGGEQRIFKIFPRCRPSRQRRPHCRHFGGQGGGSAFVRLQRQHMQEERGRPRVVELALARDAHALRLLRERRLNFDPCG